MTNKEFLRKITLKMGQVQDHLATSYRLTTCILISFLKHGGWGGERGYSHVKTYGDGSVFARNP